MPNDAPQPVLEAEAAPALTPPAPAPASTAPLLTVKISETRLQAEVSQTVKEGDDYYKLGGTLELPLDATGRYDVAQLEGALASLTVVTARLNGLISQAWQIKQRALRAERQRQQLTAKLAAALQGIGVPTADMEAVLVEFFGGLPASPMEVPTTLGKIIAMRNTTERPSGWRWRVPVLARKSPPGAPAGTSKPPAGNGAGPRLPATPPAAPSA